MIKQKPKIVSISKPPTVTDEAEIDVGEFTQIIHLSDIHIRPLQRHDEYKEVFRVTMSEISRLRQVQKSVIVLTGDVFDHKTVFRPETFKMCRDFVKQLAQIAPVIMIAGNHDMLEQNTTTRMDSLTPVVDDIPGVHYLKNSGVYKSRLTNDCFVVSSLYDKKFISCPVATASNYICLYHGDITGSYLEEDDIPIAASTRNRSKEDFNGFDAVLLGDIHKHQVFQNDKGSYMAYAGSLIQQNHGEPLDGHGFLVWRKTKNTWGAPQHISVPNNYGFVDIHCFNGEWIDRPLNPLPVHCYARLLIHDCTQTQLDLICAEVKRHVPEDGSLIITKKHAVSVNRDEEAATEQAPDLKRKEDEIALILEQAKEHGMDGPRLVNIHKEYQSQVDVASSVMSSAVWRPVWVEFKNLFGYGGGAVNFIRFKRGLTSISAGNACGKSSTVNALLFGIFGRVPLNPSSSSLTYDVVNNRETGGYIKILLNHGGVYYLIERQSCKPKGKTTAADLQKLTKFDFTCEIWESNLHGEKLVNRCDTRQNNNDTFIAELFGDLADFSLTNLLNKESSLDLLSMTPSDQVKTLKSLFKMDVYDTYRELNKKKLSELESNLTKLRVKHQSFQNLIDPGINEEAVSSLKDSVAIKQGEEAEELELFETQQTEYQELISHMRMLESQVPKVSESLESLQDEFDELSLNVSLNTEEDTLSADVLAVKLENLSAKIERLSLELEEVDFSKLQTTQELQALLLDLTDELEATPGHGCEKSMSPAQINKKLGAIQAKLDAIECDDPDIVLRDVDTIKAELLNFKFKFQADTQTQIRDIEYAKKRLTERKKPPSADETIESLSLKLTPGIATEFTDANERQLVKKKDELNRREQELTGFNTLVITDTETVINQLCDCPLIDEAGANKFGLTGEFRLIEDNLMERLIVHFENEHEHQKVIPIMADIGSLTQQIEHLSAVKKNADIQKQIAWLQYGEYEEQLAQLEHVQQLKEELRQAEARAGMDDLKQQHEELNNMITYYEILDDIKTVKANLTFHQLREELTSLVSEQEELNERLKRQESWERYNYLSSAIESYESIKQLEQLKLKAQQQQKQIAGTKYALQATQRSLRNAEEQLSLMGFKLEQQIKYRDELTKLEAELIKLEQEVKPLSDYGILMGSKGIASRMLFQKIKSIETYINSILQSFTRYSISIIFDDKKQTMHIIAEDKESGRALSTARFSGYEKLMLQIAFKRALNKFSYNSKSSLIIIDEALDCIDTDNFQSKLPDVMNLITQDYSTCLAISQRDISHISDVNMTIRRDGGYSQLD